MIAPSAARLGLVALAALAGCGEPTSTVAGVLAVTTATAGPSPDPDGYVVRIDGTLLRRARVGDTVAVLLADGGTHAVVLGEVSANCVVTGDSVRATPVPQADTAWVHFEVTCRATTGALRITTVGTGQELDPSGYQLSITGAEQPVTLESNGVYTTDLPSGHYGLTLTGSTQNCVAESPVREVDVVAGGTSDVTFTVECTAAAPAGAGHEIAFVTDRLPLDGQAPVRVYLMNEDGTGLRARTGVPRDYLIGLDWLPDGRTLGFLSTPVFEDPFGVVSTMDAESGTIDTLFAGSAVGQPEWSPDGSHMAFVDKVDIFATDHEVFVAGPDGSDRRQLTSDGGFHSSPTWSPDGTQLAYVTLGGVADELGNLGRRIVVRSLADPTETPVLADFRGDIGRITWSPTGTTIAFAGALDFEDGHIFTVPATGGEATQLTRGRSNGQPAWSPDGRFIAFASDRDGNNEIYVMNADGSNETRLTNNPAQDSGPAWRP